MQKRRPALLMTLGTAIVLMAGGAGAYWWLSKRPVPTGELPLGANVVPETALMTVSFSTNESDWQRLRQFGTPETQANLDQALAEWRDRLLIANGYSYQQDIQPWIGPEMMVAFLPPIPAGEGEEGESSLGNGLENGLGNLPERGSIASPEEVLTSSSHLPLLVLPIDNPERAQELVGSPKGDAVWTELDYRGLKIRQVQSQDEQTYSSTVLDNRFLVIATQAHTIEQAIDTYQGNPSVMATPGYQQAFSQLPASETFLRLYVNVPATRAIAAEQNSLPLGGPRIMPLQTNQGLAATVQIEPDGLRLQGIAWLDADSETRYTVSNNAGRMPGLLPADTLMMASGGNLQQIWQGFSQTAAAAPQRGPFNPDNVRAGLRTTTGLDLDEDLMPWMGGEFALALIPVADENAESGQELGVLFMVQASDRQAADQSFAQLNDVMRSRYGFQVNEADLNGTPVTNWVSPFAALTMTHGWLDGNVAFLAFRAPVATTVVPKPSSTLAQAERFRQATATDLNGNNGHFFVDLDRLLSDSSSLPIPPLAPDNSSVVRAIESIGITTAILDERSTRYDIHIMLRQAGDPGPLPGPASGSAETDGGPADLPSEDPAAPANP